MQAPATHKTDADVELSDELLISAYMDGDPAPHPDALATLQGRQAWDVYHLIGDTIRSNELGIVTHHSLAIRISQAIESEPALAAPVRSEAMQARQSIKVSNHRAGVMRRIVWPSLAMAAAVASVVWVARPLFIPDQGVAPMQSIAAAEPAKPVDPAAVNDYLQAHRQLSGPAAIRQVTFNPGASR